ncbi:MAG TPA: class I SAM-dependent methyltransferase, partial [Thalassobaculum sp.]
AWFGPIGHYEALATIGRTLRPRVYLEIGVDRGGSLAVAHADARRIAVDPAPRLDRIAHPELARPGLELFAITSDAFFERFERDLPGVTIDLAFIDGLHEAGQLLRDFRETERRCRPDATILLHDVLPLHRVSAEPRRRISFWVGDCWRVLCLLVQERPDLDIAIVRTAPSGLAVIRNLDPGDRRLFADGDRLRQRLAALDLGRDFVPTIRRLPWAEPDRASLRQLLGNRNS